MRLKLNKTTSYSFIPNRMEMDTKYTTKPQHFHIKLPKLPSWIDKANELCIIAIFFMPVPMLCYTIWIDLVLFQRQVSRYTYKRKRKRNRNQTHFNSNIYANPCVGVNRGCPHIEAKHKILCRKKPFHRSPANQPANKLSEKRVSIQLKGLDSCFLLLSRLISPSFAFLSFRFVHVLFPFSSGCTK